MKMKLIIIIQLLLVGSNVKAQNDVRSIVSVMTKMDKYWTSKQVDSLLQIKSDSIKVLYAELIRIKTDSTDFGNGFKLGPTKNSLEVDFSKVNAKLAALEKRIDDIIAVLPVKPGELIK